MQTSKYEGLQITNGYKQKVQDALVIEAALQININTEPYTVVMRTPGDDFELIRGLLYAEDIYKGKENLAIDVVEKRDNGFSILNATIPKKSLGKGYLNKRTLLSVSSCGICGKQKLEDINYSGSKLKNKTYFDSTRLEEMFIEMKLRQETFEVSGGSHAAAIFNKNYEIISLKEDIGRHNAVDKVVGELLNSDQLKKSFVMLVSGRVSYEIISKAFIAKIPIVVAVSACSTLAVDFAKEFGICLIGFSRGSKATIYAN
ncbi:MAG: formate dehydrogenase accessory sulfurtransferase FdhD [Lutibacter sp.]